MLVRILIRRYVRLVVAIRLAEVAFRVRPILEAYLIARAHIPCKALVIVIFENVLLEPIEVIVVATVVDLLKFLVVERCVLVADVNTNHRLPQTLKLAMY